MIEFWSLRPLSSVWETFKLTLDEAVQWLGLSKEILLERLDKEWGGLPIELEDIKIIAQDNSNVLQLEGSFTAW